MTFTKDDAMAFVLAAREAEQPEEFEALADNLVEHIVALGQSADLEKITLWDRSKKKEPRKPWFGGGNRQNHPPFLWTSHRFGYQRFWASALATASIVFFATIVPVYVILAAFFPSLLYIHGEGSGEPLAITLWVAGMSGLIVGSIAARPPHD